MTTEAASPRQPSRLSPVTAHHLAEAARADEHGAADALSNHPPADATLPSQTEFAVIARAGEVCAEIRREAGDRLSGLSADIIANREAFAEERYVTRIRVIETSLKAMLAKAGGDLEQHVADALKAKREYDHFNYANRLTADPRPDKWQVTLAFLTVPLAIESLLNGAFFADASDFGLVGGAMTAVIISALNIALGFVTGWAPARYCGHARGSHLLWALPAFMMLIVAILLFNLAVGHYRELLIADPDAVSQQVVPRMRADLLAISDLKSIALVLIGCLIAGIAAAKGYAAFGTYPGQSASFRHWRERQNAVEATRRRLDIDLVPELETLRGQIDSFRDECQRELARMHGARAAAERVHDDYLTRVAQLRCAKDAALMQYREANLRVRSDMPPAYFSQLFSLAELDAPGDLPERATLLRLIADVERQLTTMPALIEAKLKDQLVLIRGLDLAGEIERLKASAARAGRDAYDREEAARQQIPADFAAMPR